jgi:hypothetical protein
MHRLATAASIAILLVVGGVGGLAGDLPRHEISGRIEPASHRLEVRDRITLPPALAGAGLEFVLNARLEIAGSDPPLERVPLGDTAPLFGINSSGDEADEAEEGVELARYRLQAVPEDGVLELSYAGELYYELSDEREEYTRGFRETAGVIGEEGIFLSAATVWYPRFDDGLIEFELELAVPADWHVVSQGNGSSRDERGMARWSSGGPMDEIYLCGGPLLLYREAAGAVEGQVYLRERDDALAERYLGATAQYLEMYRELIGPYPYGKFALVENFWETGFGMPSFTVLGPTVIRFPFILHSSYPHEILHNWWGNSVFVDYASGNWCEGLTAYMADHLVQEQRGRGAEYRRGTLQKYRDYVKEGRDFPLVEFRSRHSAATEAVGYGRSLMGFHMLRRQFGDDAFRATLARFYREQKGSRASFGDLRRYFEEETGQKLGPFFEAWIERTGAPELRVEVAEVLEVIVPAGAGYQLRGTLRQVQAGDPFPLEVLLAVRTESGSTTHTVQMDRREQPFELELDGDPLLLQVDPWFDLFRQLDPRETPPSIGQLFGAPRILALLPAAASDETRQRYRELLEGWVSESHEIEIRMDDEVPTLPADRSVWIVGRENRHAAAQLADGGPAGLAVGDERVGFLEESVPFTDHSLVAIRRHPQNLELVLGWLVVEPDAAFPGLGRKLPHYGKYSYLAFEGEEPTNVIKGQWEPSGSPLRVDLRPESRRAEPLPVPAEDQRAALAELPPVFSERALAAHVEFLAAPEREGRGLGSAGLRQAADYIARRFESAGLLPGGDDGGWLQRFTVARGPDGSPVEAFNVVGVLPGHRDDWSEQSIVLGAHYDHLGRGWPDVHQGDEGKIHPGADDNASGVAVLLELAANLAAGEAPSRSLAFVAFSGEEAGRLGSIAYLSAKRPLPVEGIRAMINLDTVGRLFDTPLTVIATGTAREWPHIFRGCSYVTGVESRNVNEPLDASDQVSFIERGIPAVQLFTRAHGDYHRPGDTADAVDVAGLVKVATFTREALVYLVEREQPLEVTIEGSAAEAPPPSAGQGGGRRVSFGIVPEFGFAGPGVEASGIVPGSPAEQAGLQSGDVLLQVNGEEIENLSAFSALLKRLAPGQTVEATVRRGEERLSVPVTLVAR